MKLDTLFGGTNSLRENISTFNDSENQKLKSHKEVMTSTREVFANIKISKKSTSVSKVTKEIKVLTPESSKVLDNKDEHDSLFDGSFEVEKYQPITSINFMSTDRNEVTNSRLIKRVLSRHRKNRSKVKVREKEGIRLLDKSKKFKEPIIAVGTNSIVNEPIHSTPGTNKVLRKRPSTAM